MILRRNEPSGWAGFFALPCQGLCSSQVQPRYRGLRKIGTVRLKGSASARCCRGSGTRPARNDRKH